MKPKVKSKIYCMHCWGGCKKFAKRLYAKSVRRHYKIGANAQRHYIALNELVSRSRKTPLVTE